tara:strand:- start:976 stop:1197 length:222 start_codon:yes stop_codon:yes gene_type:complete
MQNKIKRVKVSDKNKELLNKATGGDIYLDPNTTYYAKVKITALSQIVDIEDTPFTITIPYQGGEIKVKTNILK